ncbi:Hypothetical protein Tpal_459 [Trichococcus palustris]|uniref:Abi-like protein n=1 Tax=Trichococcus palustris TaxID=140314 RepID=A0A143Y777_9LACT|nr:Abi family protein [Trichococcus palustris]CZQ83547.1 Hypothetical protein Tpal_459 [Trichococcus palustris]SFK70067.1 Abortive infection bacteriophage resistance protein [Trichococcus palustris]
MSDNIPFKSFEEQLVKIQEKNIDIISEDFTINSLKNHSYYTLINGYKHLFLKPGETDIMIDGTCFEDFSVAYYIDTNISSLIFKYILFIERGLRTRVSYVVANTFGVENTGDNSYLKRGLYLDSRRLRGSTLRDLDDCIRNCKQGSVTYYYKENKANIPPWIVVNDISFFNTISWFEILPYDFKQMILTDYFNNSELPERGHADFLYYSMNFLRDYRNIAAHGKRNFKEKIKHYISPGNSLQFFGTTLLTQSDIDNGFGFKDLYTVIILILKYTFDEVVLSNFVQELLVSLLPYIDSETYEPNKLINGKNIYQILNIPENTMTRIFTYIEELYAK